MVALSLVPPLANGQPADADIVGPTPFQTAAPAKWRDGYINWKGRKVFAPDWRSFKSGLGDNFVVDMKEAGVSTRPLPELTDRRNLIVMADEAHRSQYGFDAKLNQQTGVRRYGYAHYIRQAMPNASFIGFTGTPIELNDKNTRSVFGDYINFKLTGERRIDLCEASCGYMFDIRAL